VPRDTWRISNSLTIQLHNLISISGEMEKGMGIWKGDNFFKRLGKNS
jgi:hypothetical protein